MDVLWFLKERTKFILRFYDEASKPFEQKKKTSRTVPRHTFRTTARTESLSTLKSGWMQTRQ